MVDLVLTAVRIAILPREHEGQPVGVGLVHHSDAGSQGLGLCALEN